MGRKYYLCCVTFITNLSMKYKESYFFCSQHLLSNVAEVQEVFSFIDAIKWLPEFKIEQDSIQYKNKTAYNKAFDIEFLKYNWIQNSIFSDDPKSIGEYKKNDVFVEIQFGKSETIYRDYYKFHNGFAKNLISLAILIVPTTPKDFFPLRSRVSNFAEFDFANRVFKLLPIPVPILLIGLLPEN